MEWLDEGIVLSARPHGENAAVVTLLTPHQGRHAGLVAGGQGRGARPILQPGNRVKAKWRARLVEQLGNYTLDLLAPHAAAWLDNPEVLAIISSACAVTEASLPERQPMPGVYAGLATLLSLPDQDLWGPAYVKWEIGLLKALGYGFDLTQCAASGEADNLVYVSPRTGRAVSSKAGEPYREKLLPLPGFLIGAAEWTAQDILQGLSLTAHFLRTHVFSHPHNRLLIKQDGDLPQARQRLAGFYEKAVESAEADVAVKINWKVRMNCELIKVSTEDDWRAYHDIRLRILWDEKGRTGYDPNREEEHSPVNHPFLLKLDAQPIGTTRLDNFGNGTGAFRLVAIDKKFQGQGYGRKLSEMVESFARDLGIHTLFVNAAPEAIGFYEKLDWKPFSWNPEELVGIVAGCVQMRKLLTTARKA